MPPRIQNIQDIAQFQLCSGCGACAWAAPDQIEMVDVLDQGRRPVLRASATDTGDSKRAMAVCPGLDTTHNQAANPEGFGHPLAKSWGPILQIWEGYAADPEIRFRASSGGATTALATYCIEVLGMQGMVHIAARSDVPYLNESVVSRSRDELLERAGSRYAPASPCDRLGEIEGASQPSVIAGKPCDIAAVERARKLSPELDSKVGLTIACFCAGTPTTRGTLKMLQRMGIEDPTKLRSLRYRGHGWPGQATAVIEVDGQLEERKLTYEQSWGDILTKHKQWRCNLCPDRTGEFADIAVGDPWYRDIEPGDAGRSMIIARTPRGREILEGAISSGYLEVTPSEDWQLPASQHWVPELRGAIWGRLFALRLFRLPTPSLGGFHLFWHFRRSMSWMARLKSIVGTIRRIPRRGLGRRQELKPYEGIGEDEHEA